MRKPSTIHSPEHKKRPALPLVIFFVALLAVAGWSVVGTTASLGGGFAAELLATGSGPDETDVGWLAPGEPLATGSGPDETDVGWLAPGEPLATGSGPDETDVG